MLSLVLDYLAIGIDPARSVIFAHSAVPELNQLLLPFLSLVTASELQRNPTVKDEIAHSRQASVSGLMLTYPVHQAADILAVKGNLVPVGQDQLPHVEVTRLVARRFNERYPGAGGGARLPRAGRAAVGRAAAARHRRRQDVQVPRQRDRAAGHRGRDRAAGQAGEDRRAAAHQLRPGSAAPRCRRWCCWPRCASAATRRRSPRRSATAARRQLKRTVTEAVNERFAPVRARRAELAADPGYARQVLRDGCARARAVAAATLEEVRDAMGTRY